MTRIALITVVLLGCAAPAARAALAVPAAAPGFVVENAIPGSHIEAPVGLAFTPDGRLLVADVPGRVWVIENGVQLPVPMWAHEAEVEINGDCGLLGMALDPNFATNRRIYLLYSVDPDSNGVDDDSVHFGRLVRYEVSATDPNLIDESTRTVLLGTGWADGIPNYSGTHSVGALRFGEDGTLFVSAGEGARYDMADPGGISPALFQPGLAPLAWDRGAYRALMLDCPGGKVLRIDPQTGHGLPSNPFWDGDPGSVRSKVWAYGMRNPFRFCVRPGTGAADPSAGNPGTLLIGDVGWNLWEEVDVVQPRRRELRLAVPRGSAREHALLGAQAVLWRLRRDERRDRAVPGDQPRFARFERARSRARQRRHARALLHADAVPRSMAGDVRLRRLLPRLDRRGAPGRRQSRALERRAGDRHERPRRLRGRARHRLAVRGVHHRRHRAPHALGAGRRTSHRFPRCSRCRRRRPTRRATARPSRWRCRAPARSRSKCWTPRAAASGARRPRTYAAGRVTLEWNGTDARGARVAPGLYFARVSAAGAGSRGG